MVVNVLDISTLRPSKVFILPKSAMAPSTNYARRGGKVFSSLRAQTSPISNRKSGIGLGKSISHRRHKVLPKDTVLGITKNDIRRLARRGGVKRISAGVYDTARLYLKDFLREAFQSIVASSNV
jgi:hypothetical protein